MENEIILTREDIIGYKTLKREKVVIPEIKEGAVVFISEMTAADRDEFEYETFIKGNPDVGIGIDTKDKTKMLSPMKNIRAALVAKTAVDENGKRLFTSKDVEALGKIAAKPIDRMFEVAQRLNGMKKEDLEVVVKN